MRDRGEDDEAAAMTSAIMSFEICSIATESEKAAVGTLGSLLKGGRSVQSVTGFTFLVNTLLIDSWKGRSAGEQ